MRVPTIELMVGCLLMIPVARAGVQPGDPAPLFVSVSENLDQVDMADFIAGTPLVFLYGSAT